MKADRQLRLLTILCLCYLTAGFSGCRDGSGGEAFPQNRQQTGPVTICRAEKTAVREVFRGYGHISFSRKADVTPAVDGRISSIDVSEGELVQEGQLLAVLENRQLEIRAQQAEAAVLSAVSALDLCRAKLRDGRLQTEQRLLSLKQTVIKHSQKIQELEHQRKLLENNEKLRELGGVSEEKIQSARLSFSALQTEILVMETDIEIMKTGFRDEDILSAGYPVPDDPHERRKLLLQINTASLSAETSAAEAGLESAMTEKRSAELMLSERLIKAPFNGQIAARHLEQGERVGSDSSIFTIIDCSSMNIVFQVPDGIGIKLEAKQNIALYVDAHGGREHRAEISLISPAVDAGSGNFSVKAVLHGDTSDIRPGMFARIKLDYGDPRETVLVPADTVARTAGEKSILFMLKNGRAYPIEAVTGGVFGERLEVVSGLDGGERLINNPPPLLKEGDYVVSK